MVRWLLSMIVAFALAVGAMGCKSTSGESHVLRTGPRPERVGAPLAGLQGSPAPANQTPAAATATAAAVPLATGTPVSKGVDTKADPVGLGLLIAAFAGVVLAVTTSDHRAHPSQPTGDHRRATPAAAARATDGGTGTAD